MVMVTMQHVSVPEGGIRFQEGAIEALLGDEVVGKGTLYITEEVIKWVRDGDGEGFTIQYKQLVVHAISRDPNVHPRHCLYVMVNGIVQGDQEAEAAEQGGPEAEEDEVSTELRFIPDNSDKIDELYKAVQECSLLHPDQSSDMSEDNSEEVEDEEGEEEYDEEDGDVAGRPLPNAADEQERQLREMQNYFGDRLTFQQGQGNGHGNSNGSGQQNSAPRREPTMEEMREMFEDPDEDPMS